jgi:hypothetical protein
VKQYKKTIGKACIVRNCSKSAKVTAVRKNNGMIMHVAHCIEHAKQGGIISA